MSFVLTGYSIASFMGSCGDERADFIFSLRLDWPVVLLSPAGKVRSWAGAFEVYAMYLGSLRVRETSNAR